MYRYVAPILVGLSIAACQGEPSFDRLDDSESKDLGDAPTVGPVLRTVTGGLATLGTPGTGSGGAAGSGVGAAGGAAGAPTEPQMPCVNKDALLAAPGTPDCGSSTVCDSDADCAIEPGTYCESDVCASGGCLVGRCSPTKAQGEACTRGAECSSGICDCAQAPCTCAPAAGNGFCLMCPDGGLHG